MAGDLTPGPNDAWALDGNDYSTDKFYTRSTDGRGNSELIQLKVTPFQFGVIAELVESPDFPDYRTKADFLRDAIVHRLHYLRGMISDEKRMALLHHKIERLMAEAKVERLKADMEQERRFADSLIEAMNMGIQSGNVSRAAEAIEEAERALEKLPINLAKKVRVEMRERIRELAGVKAMAALETGGEE